MKYGCISIERGSINKDGKRVVNIGDYMQLIGILNLYRRMGISEDEIVRIEYYDLFDYSGEDVIIPINFIWFNPYWGERELVLSDKIHPVFLGIHSIGDDYSKREVEYLRSNEPVGCRDAYTLQIMQKLGIKSYLHGCISASLPLRKKRPKDGRIYLVDVQEELMQYIPSNIKDNAVICSHQYYGEDMGKHNWEDVAKTRLNNYKEDASMVITSRLHCAGPCMASGIPIVFAAKKRASSYSWIDQLITFYDKERWAEIDWNPRMIQYETLKEEIIKDDIDRIEKMFNGSIRGKCKNFFEPNKSLCRGYENGELMRIKQFTSDNWEKTGSIRYSLWGVTQMAEHAYKFIGELFPNAQLIDVYDNYRDMSFLEHKTKKIEEYSIEDKVYLIATGNTTSIAARDLFVDNGWDQSYLCTCYEGLHKKVED